MSTANSPKTPTPPTLPPGVTKTCHIVKRPDFDGYGFNLHSEKVKPGQFIGKVDADSPAEAAGLKEGDRILEVNGVSIGNETHKQVVARIKAIANEVRLLLIDVDGKAHEMPAKSASPAASPVPNGSDSGSGIGSPPCYEGTKQEMPGASANISSISVTSTKRVSNASSIQSGSTMNASDVDVVDRGMPAVPVPAPVAAPLPVQNGSKSPSNNSSNNNSNNNNNINNNNNNNNNKMMSTPPPPSATVANMNNNGSVYSSSNGNGSANVNGNGSATPTAMPTPPSHATTNRAGSLNLPLTAAEMRAKLASKKKYDPKNESVDLKKKFEIIQKL